MSQESQAKRLNKYISETGFCSRREADKLIDAGRVTINGKIPEMGTKVLPGDDVEIDNKPVRSKEKPIYIALNKPTGITCTTERDIPGNIVDFIEIEATFAGNDVRACWLMTNFHNPTGTLLNKKSQPPEQKHVTKQLPD